MPEATKVSEYFFCPRRPVAKGETLDTWETIDGFQRCSHCGSLHPDEAIKAIEAGAAATVVDDGERIFVDLPDPKAGEMRVSGIRNSDPEDEAWINITEDNIAEVVADGWGDDHIGHWMMKTPRLATSGGQLMLKHLSDAERVKLDGLLGA
jgi:hypothetical protein